MSFAGRRGKRTEFSKSVRLEAQRLVPNKSITAAKTIPAKMSYECFVAEERYDADTDSIIEVYIEDKSLTKKQFLRIGGTRPTEIVDLKGKRLDHKTGNLVITSDPKVLSMSDHSLLNLSTPFADRSLMLKRQTAGSKRIRFDEDAPLGPKERISTNTEIDFSEPIKPVSKRSNGRIL